MVDDDFVHGFGNNKASGGSANDDDPSDRRIVENYEKDHAKNGENQKQYEKPINESVLHFDTLTVMRLPS